MSLLETSPIDALAQYLDRWAAAHRSCAPADRGIVEEGIALAYATASLKPPSRIGWCDGPEGAGRPRRGNSQPAS